MADQAGGFARVRRIGKPIRLWRGLIVCARHASLSPYAETDMDHASVFEGLDFRDGDAWCGSSGPCLFSGLNAEPEDSRELSAFRGIASAKRREQVASQMASATSCSSAVASTTTQRSGSAAAIAR